MSITMLENIDIECLINWIDPEWKRHFGHLDDALAAYTHPKWGLTPKEMVDAINESGARND